MASEPGAMSRIHLLRQPRNSNSDDSSAKDHQGISTASVETPDDGLAKKIMSEKGGSIAQPVRNDDSKRKKEDKSKDGLHTPGDILEERIAKKLASEPGAMSRMHLLSQRSINISDDNSAKDQQGISTSSVETPDNRLAKKIMSEKGGSIAQPVRNDDSKRKKEYNSKDGQHTPGKILEEQIAKKLASEPGAMSWIHQLRGPVYSNSDDSSAEAREGISTASVETPDDILAKKIMSENGGSNAQAVRNEEDEWKKRNKSKDGQNMPTKTLEERIAKKNWPLCQVHCPVCVY